MEHWLIQAMVDNPIATGVSAVIALCFTSVAGAFIYDRRASIKAYLEHRRSIRIQRGLQMGKKKKVERLAYLKGRWGDGITDFGEKEFLEGRQTREEVNDFYRAIGKTHNMPDLIPVLTNSQLKSVIKGRRARGIGVSTGPAQEQPAWGDPPSTTNDKKSGASNVVDAKKRFGAKALAFKKTA